ncbi:MULTISPECIES: hypothetical protein [unclassified Nostoc]|nr:MULTISPECIES: hypothetical protein [unclassified Nostoc]MBD2467990.1 hypothetical protein [Nostoc sp. FACHB-145]
MIGDRGQVTGDRVKSPVMCNIVLAVAIRAIALLPIRFWDVEPQVNYLWF